MRALHEHELHTLETFVVGFGAQQVSVTAVPTFSASDYILSYAMCSQYWHPVDRGGLLVELHTHGRPVAHGH